MEQEKNIPDFPARHNAPVRGTGGGLRFVLNPLLDGLATYKPAE